MSNRTIIMDYSKNPLTYLTMEKVHSDKVELYYRRGAKTGDTDMIPLTKDQFMKIGKETGWL